jgi:hypothetical protein
MTAHLYLCLFTLASFSLCAAPGCGAPADDAAIPDIADGKGDGNEQLQSVQIKEVHAILGDQSFGYTGHPRYVGAWFNAKEGYLLTASSEINEELRPVIALTDEHLTVLSKISGGTLTGAPNTSSAFLQFAIPADGKYWLLFGEAARTPQTIKTGAVLQAPAGTPCHHGGECLSATCGADSTCAQSRSGGGDQECVQDADCLSGKCDADVFVCAWAALGHACKGDGECASMLCTGGTCSCLAAGQAIADNDNPVKCCSAGAVAAPNGKLACR